MVIFSKIFFNDSLTILKISSLIKTNFSLFIHLNFRPKINKIIFPSASNVLKSCANKFKVRKYLVFFLLHYLFSKNDFALFKNTSVKEYIDILLM